MICIYYIAYRKILAVIPLYLHASCDPECSGHWLIKGLLSWVSLGRACHLVLWGPKLPILGLSLYLSLFFYCPLTCMFPPQGREFAKETTSFVNSYLRCLTSVS